VKKVMEIDAEKEKKDDENDAALISERVKDDEEVNNSI